MTQQEIRQRREAVLHDLQVMRNEQEVREAPLVAELRGLVRLCSYPDKYRYTAQGDPGEKCPDCGYQT